MSDSDWFVPPWLEYGLQDPDHREVSGPSALDKENVDEALDRLNRNEHRPIESASIDHVQVRSRVRVRELAEVFTNRREIDAMLDTVRDSFNYLDAKFLEPAAGNGNFLVEILVLKLEGVREMEAGSQSRYEHRLLRALASIYGVDISEENVFEARNRMAHTLISHLNNEGSIERITDEFLLSAALILEANIVVGDTIGRPEEIELCEWVPTSHGRFQRRWSPALVPPEQRDLFWTERIEDPEPIHYSQLAASNFDHQISLLKRG